MLGHLVSNSGSPWRQPFLSPGWFKRLISFLTRH